MATMAAYTMVRPAATTDVTVVAAMLTTGGTSDDQHGDQ